MSQMNDENDIDHLKQTLEYYKRINKLLWKICAEVRHLKTENKILKSEVRKLVMMYDKGAISGCVIENLRILSADNTNQEVKK